MRQVDPHCSTRFFKSFRNLRDCFPISDPYSISHVPRAIFRTMSHYSLVLYLFHVPHLVFYALHPHVLYSRVPYTTSYIPCLVLYIPYPTFHPHSTYHPIFCIPRPISHIVRFVLRIHILYPTFHVYIREHRSSRLKTLVKCRNKWN